jgi:hypothetical protein
MSLNTVPADILLEIADYLSCSAEVLHLSLTVRANYHSVPPLHTEDTHHSHRESPMRSPQPSIRASSCAVLHNACARSICSTLGPSVHDMSARSASARTHLAAGHRRGGAVGYCPMRMQCRLPCAVRRSISRSCVALPGTARSCPRMTTCGSRCASRASSLPSVY